MKIIVVYDNIDAVADKGKLPEDFGAEYDDACAVRGIMNALEDSGHEVESLCLDLNFVKNITALKPDCVFNISEGVRGRGRESLVPAWLDHLGICYTGSDAVTLGVSLDKALTKRLALGVGVRTPDFVVVEHLEQIDDLQLDFPMFLKPVAEGSSMGIRRSSLVENKEELLEVTEWVLSQYRQGCLIEQFLPGREFCVGLVGNRRTEVFPVVEVKFEGGFYSYEQKSEHRKELICPADIPSSLEKEMVQAALTIYSAIGCRDLARVDFKLDSEQRPAFLEINPLPGLAKKYGIFPRQAIASGMDYNKLINNIVELAVKRQKKHG